MGAIDYNAVIARRIEVASGLIILRVVPDRRDFNFVAGQYTVLGLKRSAPRVASADPEDEPAGGDSDRMVRRAYSIASSSRPGEHLEFYVTLVESGELTPRLFALKEGDRLWVGPKATGIFTLQRVAADRHLLLVATGTGLAPYMSMLRTDLTCNGVRIYVILHGARYSWDLGYRAELEGLARRCSNVFYLPSVSRPVGDPSWKGLTGYLQDVLLSGIVESETGLKVDPEHLDVFLCGNPGMIEAAKEKLIQRGFVPDKGRTTGTLHTEEYW